MSMFYDWFDENKIEVKVDFTDTEKLEFLDEIVEAENRCRLIRGINELLGDEWYPELIENRIWKYCDKISKEHGSKYGILSTSNLVDIGSLTYDLGATLLLFISELEDGETRVKYREALRNQLNGFDSIRLEEYRARTDLFERTAKVIGDNNGDLIAYYLDRVDDIILGNSTKNPFDDFRGLSEENDEFIEYFDSKINKPEE